MAAASLDILFGGYVGARVAGTVSLIRDGGLVAVVDPGMVPDRSAILDPLAELGCLRIRSRTSSSAITIPTTP